MSAETRGNSNGIIVYMGLLTARKRKRMACGSVSALSAIEAGGAFMDMTGMS